MLSGGVKLIPMTAPKGTFRVWTKRVGNNPGIKVHLLQGGPGAAHEYTEAFDRHFPKEGIEYYCYDQLGSALSDQPKDPSRWDLPRLGDWISFACDSAGGRGKPDTRRHGLPQVA